jgi:predicted AAA+ superfamily ATPase
MRKLTPRRLITVANAASRGFPAVLVTGPRRSGKTTLLRLMRPNADYRLLEDPDTLAQVHDDPRGFLDGLRFPTILDEIQNVPELLPYIRSRIDATTGQKGRWLLTGSQEAPLMKGVTESMAGRVAIFQLLPFSHQENDKVSPFLGGFPEVLARPKLAETWFRSYVQTYLERDVRAVSGIRDLSAFRRFLGLLATRTGQILNKTDLAGPLGVSIPTVDSWIGILEVTGLLLLAQPFTENFGKRLIKSPKVYFSDTGLVCHLLGLRSAADLARSPFSGPMFENHVACEIVKAQQHHGRRRELYFLRDKTGIEVDFAVPTGARRLALVEAKTTRTILPKMGQPMRQFMGAAKAYECQGWVVHPGPDLVGFSGAGEGVRTCSADSIPTKILGLRA